MCFPLKFAKILGVPILKSICEGLLQEHLVDISIHSDVLLNTAIRKIEQTSLKTLFKLNCLIF